MKKHIGWLRVLAIAIPYLISVILFGFLGYYLVGASLTNDNKTLTFPQELGVKFAEFLGTMFVLFIFMKFVDKEKFSQLGFQKKDRFKNFNYGTLIASLMMLFGFLFLYFTNEIHLTKSTINFKNIFISLALFAIVAVVEEALFRGYVLRNLMLSFNKYVALILSSVLFSLVHGANPNMDMFSLFSLFLAGVFLGISYMYTKNLWFPIGLHFGWNLVQTFLGFNVSGQDFYSIINFNITENNLLNGGKFGFEGSYLSLMLEIICIFSIVRYYGFKKKNNL